MQQYLRVNVYEVRIHDVDRIEIKGSKLVNFAILLTIVLLYTKSNIKQSVSYSCKYNIDL